MGGVLKRAVAALAIALLAAPLLAAEKAGGQAPAAQDPEQVAFQAALQGYMGTIAELTASRRLAPHQDKLSYLLQRPGWEAYTESAVSGMYALRKVRPQDEAEVRKWLDAGGMLFEYHPIVLFPASGRGFIVRREHFAPTLHGVIVYDRDKDKDRQGLSGYFTGEEARPYVQAMLTTMDTTPLPAVGKQRPTFILYTSPSCTYSEKVEPLLEKSGLSFRIFPTYTINPRADFAETHRIFCSSDKLASFKSALAARARERAEFKRTGKAAPPKNDDDWFCPRNIMPNVLVHDLGFVFGEGYPTPSYYFADGSVISGADKLAAVIAKSKEMDAKGLYFK